MKSKNPSGRRVGWEAVVDVMKECLRVMEVYERALERRQAFLDGRYYELKSK